MTAEERYEKTWNSFLIYLNHNLKAHLTAFCQERYVNSRTMQNWMIEKGYSTDKGSKKGYLWAVNSPKLGLVFFIYEDGSRSAELILDVFEDYNGTVQSDAYIAYRKMESDAYPYIMRIACLQHIKRKFIDCGEKDKDAFLLFLSSYVSYWHSWGIPLHP